LFEIVHKIIITSNYPIELAQQFTFQKYMVLKIKVSGFQILLLMFNKLSSLCSLSKIFYSSSIVLVWRDGTFYFSGDGFSFHISVGHTKEQSCWSSNNRVKQEIS